MTAAQRRDYKNLSFLSAKPSSCMDTEDHLKIRTRFAQILCVCILCGIIVAGLWPFQAPANQVRWMQTGNGLSFGRYGTVISAGAFQKSNLGDDASESIEIWLQPEKVRGSRTILAFDSSEHPGVPFTLLQTGDVLRIQQHNIDPNNNCWTADSATHGVFQSGTRVFVAIVLGGHQTLVYVNGSLSKAFAIAGISARNLTGRLVVGTSPTAGNSWTGEIFGLAVYHAQLTASQVAQHYNDWTAGHEPDLEGEMLPAALYMFSERVGRIAHNQLDPVTDLQMPARYLVLHPRFLDPAWRRFEFGWPGWSYWEDALVNVAGFIPVGFFGLNYLLLSRTIKHPAALVILAGFALSLTIECLQWFLPTRDSGMNDLITNTFGTSLGVSLCLTPCIRAAWNKLSDGIVVGSIKAFRPSGSLEKP